MNKANEIDRTAHYFVLMHPLESVSIPGYGTVAFKSSSTREKWVECVIVEENFRLADGYKIELKSIEPEYGKETFYIEDFLSDLENNYRVVKKEPGMECVEEIWEEPLTNNTKVRHSAYTLKLVNKPKKK